MVAARSDLPALESKTWTRRVSVVSYSLPSNGGRAVVVYDGCSPYHLATTDHTDLLALLRRDLIGAEIGLRLA